MQKPFVIGIAGGNCSQKSLFAEIIKRLLIEQNKNVLLMELNNFYMQGNGDSDRWAIDFDNPNSMNWSQFKNVLDSCISNQPCKMPIYNKQTQEMYDKFIISKYEELPATNLDVIIVEGLLTLFKEDLLGKIDLKIFLETDDDVRLSRRGTKQFTKVYQDTVLQGIDVQKVLNQYNSFIRPGYINFVYPSKRAADIIVLNYGGGFSKQEQKIDANIKMDVQLKQFEQFDHKAINLIVNQVCNKV